MQEQKSITDVIKITPQKTDITLIDIFDLTLYTESNNSVEINNIKQLTKPFFYHFFNTTFIFHETLANLLNEIPYLSKSYEKFCYNFNNDDKIVYHLICIQTLNKILAKKHDNNETFNYLVYLLCGHFFFIFNLIPFKSKLKKLYFRILLLTYQILKLNQIFPEFLSHLLQDNVSSLTDSTLKMQALSLKYSSNFIIKYENYLKNNKIT